VWSSIFAVSNLNHAGITRFEIGLPSKSNPVLGVSPLTDSKGALYGRCAPKRIQRTPSMKIEATYDEASILLPRDALEAH
jgi:hypothetical protein